MTFPENYNAADARDILRYAAWLKDKTFMDVLKVDLSPKTVQPIVSGYSILEPVTSVLEDSAAEYGNVQRRGGLGNLIEEHYFHYKPNTSRDPDFPLAKLELKVTPYEERHGRGNHSDDVYYVAGERLVLTMIEFNSRPIQYNLLESHLWHKCAQILLIFYFRDRSLGNNLLYPIKYVGIFTPNAADLVIIRQDYRKIMDKIAAGKAHEISESDTMYLGACTKGSTAEKSKVLQRDSKILAKGRAFCFKSSYMTMVLNNYFISAPEAQESVVTDIQLLEELGFEGYIQSKINQYVGKSDKELCKLLDMKYTGNKAQWINLAFAMLGIKSNKAAEFLKANIVVKATRIEKDGNIRENTSFPPFKFKDLAEEKWIELDEIDDDSAHNVNADKKPSTLQAYFASAKFLFVVFKKKGDEYILKGCQLWNMPYLDLNEIVRQGWERIRDTIVNGIEFEMKPVKSGNRVGELIVSNNLPKKGDNPIVHVRPHAKKAYYKVDGYENGNPADGNELPDGRWMTTQCFWLNNTYVKSVLRDDLK